ncbi:hypothetical protein Klosneuvirus_8_3 [Klosneuvirus KNV1]|uniref:Uncharacterized protein n=1 Tax=Klosneuvirus KNV1 TaxID=1977640 RepID=A0A1V0SLF5_9VIRU|nr:hypothetical protein Klosneuvirus_8_3 [Klosneuvirus KNV1]
MESVSLQRKLIELKTKLLPLQQILLIPELKEAVDMIQKCIDTEELVETFKPYEPPICLDKVNVPQIYTDLYNINDSWHGCQEAMRTAMTYDKVDNSRFFETFDKLLNKYSEHIIMSNNYIFNIILPNLQNNFGSRGLEILVRLVMKLNLELPSRMINDQQSSLQWHACKNYFSANKNPNAIFIGFEDIIQNRSTPIHNKMQKRNFNEEIRHVDTFFQMLNRQSLYKKLDPTIIQYAKSRGGQYSHW